MRDIEKQVCSETIFNKDNPVNLAEISCTHNKVDLVLDFDLQLYSLGGSDTSSGWLGEMSGED